MIRNIHQFSTISFRQIFLQPLVRLNSTTAGSSLLTTSEQASNIKPVKTKKNYGALPTRLTLKNGELASPLAPWDGGLDTETDASNLSTNQDIVSLNPEPSRQRRSKKTTEETDPKAKKKSITTDTETRRTRVRKAKPRSNGSQEENEAVLTNVETEITPNSPTGDQCMPREPRKQLAKEILDNLAKFPHCILLTRVGQFYESLFDQAQEVSRLLSIKLAKRTWDGQRVPMCGFPLMHLDKHLKTLILQHNRSVALCEEFQRTRDPSAPLNSKPTFDRRVVRILTPGTLIDETFLNPYENNFLLAIIRTNGVNEPYESNQEVGLAWTDVSTGEFFTRKISMREFKDHLVRINPREVVLDQSLKFKSADLIRTILYEENIFVSYASTSREHLKDQEITPENDTDDIISEELQDVAPTTFSRAETIATLLLTSFLHSNLMEHSPQSFHPSRENVSRRMQIDAHTLKSLEIRENIREGGQSGTLMSAIKRTVTSSGTRLLARWLCSPSTSVEEIKSRQALVEFFYTRPSLRADLIGWMKNIEDTTRITQRFLLGKGDVDNLSSVQHTIEVWEAIKHKIMLEKSLEEAERSIPANESWKSLDKLLSRIADLRDLAKRISLAVETRTVRKGSLSEEQAEDVDDVSDAATELPFRMYSLPGTEMKWTIKPEFSEELSSLHVRLQRLQMEKDKLQDEFQKQYDAPSLTLRFTPGNGLHIHIARPRRDVERIDKSRLFTRIAESASTRIYFNQEWSILGNAILETVFAIQSAEKQAFLTLRNEVNTKANSIRRNSRIFDELDVTLAFANLASEMNFVKPNITEGNTFCVENGRHPTVEMGLLQSGRVFTTNSVTMADASRLHIITGPNMAGKSTFLRQVALITILAQIGSFIPADSADIGIVDKVFSRIGAKDDLFRDRSTFLVEMHETADILKNATNKSMVIMDEVGRGTTAKDGLAIAFATVHHLYFVNQSRALFATHFHDIVDMLGYSEEHGRSDLFPAIEFSCADVDETSNGRFAYSYRVRSGVNRDSHGLKVAHLGGMPPVVLQVAKDALDSMRASSADSAIEQDKLRQLGDRLTRSYIPER